jgi:glycosyltransferase involved in cell wall biosynthesis
LLVDTYIVNGSATNQESEEVSASGELMDGDLDRIDVVDPGSLSERRILHILPRCIGGGPERSVLAAAREMAALGIRYHHTLVVLETPVTPVMLLQARRSGATLVTRFDDADLRELVEASDVVQIHFWNHPALYSLLRRVELPSSRVIVWSHVLGTTAPQVLTEEIGDFGDLLLLTTDSSRESEGAGAAREADLSVELLTPGVDRHRLDGFVRREHEGIVVGYIGSLSDAKLHNSVVELCDAVAHPDVSFVFYGSGGDPEEVQRRFDEGGLAGRVTVHGPVDDIASALAGMDVFGYPLANDSYATSDATLKEAMWVGVPPVVLASSAPANLVSDGQSGLVVDEDGYAGAIDRLATDSELRSRLSAGAHTRARKRFDPVKAVHQHVRHIERLCELPKRSHPALPGTGEPPAAGFARSLGSLGGAFATSAGFTGGDADQADRTIASSRPGLARGEGGVVHYRNTFPDDPHLRLWAGLLALTDGNPALAADEFAAARNLGLTGHRESTRQVGSDP